MFVKCDVLSRCFVDNKRVGKQSTHGARLHREVVDVTLVHNTDDLRIRHRTCTPQRRRI